MRPVKRNETAGRILQILGIWAAFISAAVPALALTGTVTSRIGLNIRQSPQGKILGALPAGASVTILSRQGNWLRIRLRDGRQGYIWNPNNANVASRDEKTPAKKSDRLSPAARQPVSDEQPVTVASTRAAPSRTAAPARDYVVNGNYRLRAGPGVNQRVITTLSDGRTKLSVLDQNGDWLKVKTTGGKVGWVHSASATEASACIDGRCAEAAKSSVRDDAADILAATRIKASRVALGGGGNACVRSEILRAAKQVVASKYGNRSHSKGLCALGVRQILDRAGVNNGAGLGHAVDYHSKGILKRKGFVNKIGQYNAYNAPPGAILVFRGPYTDSYLRSGRMSRPYGNYVGHVTVKGDDGRYYTDGRTSSPAVANRTLVGVYVPDDVSKMPSSIQRKCK